MGFIEDIEEILGHTPEQKRMLLFLGHHARQDCQPGHEVYERTEKIDGGKQNQTVDLTDQIYFEVNKNDKFDALSGLST